MEKLGQNNIYSQYLGQYPIVRTYKGTDLINEYKPLYNPPADWSDIRTDCPENSIALYAAHSADYASYDNLGFTATCSGGYKVYIDGNVYGSYASGSTCSITWSTSGITTGDDITTPSALKAHKIWVEPATNGNNITVFQCKRVAAGGIEAQGVLWTHFNLTNAIKIIYAFGSETQVKNALLQAVTAKNNLITYNVSNEVQSGLYAAFCNSASLKYLPALKAENKTYASGVYSSFRDVPVKKVVIKNNNGEETMALINNSKVEEFVIENGLTLSSSTSVYGDARNATNLKKFPKINQNKGENFQMYNCPALEPVNIDDRFNDTRKVFRFYGTSTTPTPALKSLRVSNEAPFDGASPQIRVDYTDLDRSALVQLFNDLPYNVGYEVVGSPTISSGVVSGFSASDYLRSSIVFPASSFANNCVYQVKFTMPNSELTHSNGLIKIRFAGTADGFIISTQRRITLFVFGTNYQIYSTQNYLQLGQTYIARAIINSSYVSFYCGTSEDTLELIGTKERIGGETFASPERVYLGRGWESGASFEGSIDLNNTYIKVNDVYWFRGQPAMTKTLSCVGAAGNQLSIVGSPTITDGVASGFSSDDYLQLASSRSISLTDTFNIKTKFTTGNTVSTSSLMGNTFGNTSNGFQLNSSSQIRAVIYVTKNDDSQTSIYLYPTYHLETNTTYYADMIYDGQTKSFTTNLYSANNVLLDTATTTLSDDIVSITGFPTWRIGRGQSGPFAGAIDLNETHIKINGETWFDINNCLLPEDKDIALNKGWSLTLS